MRISVVSLFPELVLQVAAHGVVGRAHERGLMELTVVNPRDYATDAHRSVDDRPYGGGPGMVMTYGPTSKAIAAARDSSPYGAPVVFLTPSGQVFDQPLARRFAAMPGIVLLAGRYEGIDERLIEGHVDLELSLGDFVLSGGEIAAMAVIDAVTRLLPGVLGDAESAEQDSFMDGLLDYPHYTRPESVDGKDVPAVLLSGDHAAIARWRKKEALGRSYLRRPDLLEKLALDQEQQQLLDEFIRESGTDK